MNRPKVLIADESPQSAHQLANYMKSAGYDFLIAEDRASTLLALREKRPELLLVNAMLFSDGGETIRFVQHALQLSKTGIIVLGSGVNQDERTVLLDAGADDCVDLSASQSETMARVRAVLRRMERWQRQQR